MIFEAAKEPKLLVLDTYALVTYIYPITELIILLYYGPQFLSLSSGNGIQCRHSTGNKHEHPSASKHAANKGLTQQGGGTT